MEYRFVTEWRIAAPRDAVWAAIVDSLRWPTWWRGVRTVTELEPPDAAGLGGVRRYTFRSRLPYDLVFDMRTVRVEGHQLIEGAATGELAGTGRWSLTEAGADVTDVQYVWEVQTTKPWMNLLAPLLRPVFAWNHDVVMRWGEEGLRAYLDRQSR